MSVIAPNIWPPNYVDIYNKRAKILSELRKNPDLVKGALSYYEDPNNWVQFIQDWMITYDPRNSKSKTIPVLLPFILFDRQKEFINYLLETWRDGEHGLVEKSRDMGATWLCCAISICSWLFSPGTSVGWGSRKEQLVDKIGDPDSIFEKLRMLIRYLPKEFMPIGFNDKQHSSYMKLINPDNGSTITGEAGDNIGRGGRKSIYFKDESAHYERPEKIEAALADNTDVQIDISSVNGTANVFARRRKAGEVWDSKSKIEEGTTRVFIFDWREHPNKSQKWYDKRRKKAEEEGLLHIFAQEVDRDYSAAVEGVLIPAIWVQSAVDLHKRYPELLDKMQSGLQFSALDVADEGGDLNAQAGRKGIILNFLESWAQGDTGQTANKSIVNCKLMNANSFDYDSIGVGAGVKAETNRLIREKKISISNLPINPWNAAGEVQKPKERSIPGDKRSPTNKDLFANLKAQAWWSLRRRFERTHAYITKGTEYPIEDMICIPSELHNYNKLIQELSQPTYGQNSSGKIIINKKPDGSRSPNLADSVNMVYFPFKGKTKTAGAW